MIKKKKRIFFMEINLETCAQKYIFVGYLSRFCPALNTKSNNLYLQIIGFFWFSRF